MVKSEFMTYWLFDILSGDYVMMTYVLMLIFFNSL